jgi:hypothetical protein
LHSPPLVLGAVLPLTAAGRIWVIDGCPAPDTAAGGDLGVATALLAHPRNVAVHHGESLAPIASVCAAYATWATGERWGPATRLAFAAASPHAVRSLMQAGRRTFHVAWWPP